MKDIPGYENKYAIEEDGRVYSYKNKRYIKTFFDGAYMAVCLSNNKKFRVHVLLAMTFIPNPDNLPSVDHIDRNKLNNNLSNLRWADWKTQMQNQEHNRHKRAIISIDKNGNEKEYPGIRDAAKIVGLKSHKSIESVLDKDDRTAAGYKWRSK